MPWSATNATRHARYTSARALSPRQPARSNDNGIIRWSRAGRRSDKDDGVGTEYDEDHHRSTNVAPTARRSPTTARSAEASSATISFSNASDPSPADTTAGFRYAFDCDGGSLAGATYAGSGTSPTTTVHCSPMAPADEIVSGAIIDKDGGLTQYTTTVHVNNVAPTVTFTSGDTTVNESGVTLHTYTFTVSDPGDDTVIGNGTTCGVGGTQVGPTTPGFLPPPSHPMGTTFSFDCRFDDGPKDPDVQANATDSDNATGLFTTFDVHVNNVDPTADLGNDGPINEGGSATVSFSSQFDPSPADTTAGFHYAFSCTNASLAGATYAGSSTASSTSLHVRRQRHVHRPGPDHRQGRRLHRVHDRSSTVNNVAPTIRSRRPRRPSPSTSRRTPSSSRSR